MYILKRIHVTITSNLAGGTPTPLKNMSSSIGMIIPTIWKNRSHVPVTTNQKSHWFPRSSPARTVALDALLSSHDPFTSWIQAHATKPNILTVFPTFSPAMSRRWGGFHSHGDTPIARWCMFYKIPMITGGTPISGNPHMADTLLG